jgi:hypothetical protein
MAKRFKRRPSVRITREASCLSNKVLSCTNRTPPPLYHWVTAWSSGGCAFESMLTCKVSCSLSRAPIGCPHPCITRWLSGAVDAVVYAKMQGLLLFSSCTNQTGQQLCQACLCTTVRPVVFSIVHQSGMEVRHSVAQPLVCGPGYEARAARPGLLSFTCCTSWN